jgi:hypothetical protein
MDAFGNRGGSMTSLQLELFVEVIVPRHGRLLSARVLRRYVWLRSQDSLKDQEAEVTKVV